MTDEQREEKRRKDREANRERRKRTKQEMEYLIQFIETGEVPKQEVMQKSSVLLSLFRDPTTLRFTKRNLQATGGQPPNHSLNCESSLLGRAAVHFRPYSILSDGGANGLAGLSQCPEEYKLFHDAMKACALGSLAVKENQYFTKLIRKKLDDAMSTTGSALKRQDVENKPATLGKLASMLYLGLYWHISPTVGFDLEDKDACFHGSISLIVKEGAQLLQTPAGRTMFLFTRKQMVRPRSNPNPLRSSV